MIETASIAWALVATVGAVAVYVLMRREVKRAQDRAAHWKKSHDVARAGRVRSVESVAFWIKRNGDLIARLHDAEDKLRQIETKRHNSAKHARGVQLAKAKALRDTKTSELRRDLEDSLAEPERLVA